MPSAKDSAKGMPMAKGSPRGISDSHLPVRPDHPGGPVGQETKCEAISRGKD